MATFISGSSTPFGIFDNDASFVSDAPKVYEYVLRKLGDSDWMQVELSSSTVFCALEESTMEYSALVNQYQARSVLNSFLGSPTGSLDGAQQRYVQHNLEMQKRIASPYADEAGLNSTRPLYSASIETQSGVQKYDLNQLLSGTLGSQRPEIGRVYHFSPVQAYRFFGTTSALNYMNQQFNFASFTPETIFYLLPVWEDVLRGMEFKMSDKVRRSHFSYELHNNVLTLFPVPQTTMNIYFEYKLAPGLSGSLVSGSVDPTYYGVSNVSNVPFGNVSYSNLNSVAKQWIWKMTYALAKESCGLIRRKMQTIPIPNGDLSLDGGEMVNDAKMEQENLRNELRQLLEETTYQKLAEKEAATVDSTMAALKRIPIPIFVGSFLIFMFGANIIGS